MASEPRLTSRCVAAVKAFINYATKADIISSPQMSGRLRPIMRVIAWVLTAVCAATGVVIIAAVVDMIQFEGFRTWADSQLAVSTLLPFVLLVNATRYFLYAAWTGKKPQHFPGSDFFSFFFGNGDTPAIDPKDINDAMPVPPQVEQRRRRLITVTILIELAFFAVYLFVAWSCGDGCSSSTWFVVGLYSIAVVFHLVRVWEEQR